MKKAIKALLLVAALLGLFSLSACHKSGNKAPADIDKIKKSVFESQFPEMVELGKNQLGNYYTFEEGWIDEFSVYVADSENYCDEVAIFRLADSKYLMNVAAAIEQRVNSHFSAANTQNSAEFLKLSNRVVLKKGDVVVLVISEHSSDIADRLVDMFGFSEIDG